MRRINSAFTLIELLIVVAIIAILAAIAVPNFIEAQTRAKVSRTKADMRTLSTGLESYMVDHNSYPLCHRFGIATRENSSEPLVLERLSTPVSYLSAATAIRDPFKIQGRLSASTAEAHHSFRQDMKRRESYINRFPFEEHPTYEELMQLPYRR